MIRSFLLALAVLWSVACSNSEAPTNTALSLAPLYHLKAIDGAVLPIPILGPQAGSLDSGHLRRLRGDTVRIDEYSHFPPSGNYPGTGEIALGTWVATQFGDTVVLRPMAAMSPDTAFVGAGDTLTLHTRVLGGGAPALQVKVFVAP